MQLAVAGISHNKAPQDVRKKASFTKRRVVEGMNTLLGETQIEEAMILSTCNRSEIYAISEEPGEAAEILSDFYVRQAPELADYLYWKTGDEAVRHLFRVASGSRFDDPRRGDQILGQTKQALDLSASAGASGKYLNKIVREAVTYAKKTKAKYSVSESPRSLSATAVKQIMRMVPDYADKRVLIIGSGKMGTARAALYGGGGLHRRHYDDEPDLSSRGRIPDDLQIAERDPLRRPLRFREGYGYRDLGDGLSSSGPGSGA